MDPGSYGEHEDEHCWIHSLKPSAWYARTALRRKGPPINSWKQAYTLIAVNTGKKTIELLYGSKKRRIRVLERYFFERPEVSSRVRRILES
ncbi:MAG: hypothetical protein DRO40_00175 [Thermoprotei archaeon]|nr:MAG: hypothetical protein DRO40_00175 [Thermoprotei archaeon]